MSPRWILWTIPLAIACTPKDKAPQALAAEEVRVAPEMGTPTALEADDNGEMWTVVESPEYAVAVPDGWVNVPVPDDRVKMLLVGDGIGIPPIDETGEPLQAGIIVEVRRGPFNDNIAIVDALLDELKTDTTAQIDGDPYRQTVKLCDGRDAEFMAVGFTRTGESRKSMFAQVFVTDEAHDGWVTSAYLVSGAQSTITDAGSLASSWIASHALSFCLEPGQFDQTGVQLAYNALEEAVNEAAAAREAIEGPDKSIDGSTDAVAPAGTEVPVEPELEPNPVPEEPEGAAPVEEKKGPDL